MNLLLIVALVVGAGAVAGLAIWLVHRNAPEGLFHDPGRAGGVLGAVRSPFGVLLAFVVFVAYQAYNDARIEAQSEATAVRSLFETVAYFDEGAPEEVQADLVCYARAVAELEWSRMERGERSEVVDDWVANIENDMLVVSIPSVREASALSQWFDEWKERGHSRDRRLVDARNTVPAPVWLVLDLGALALLGYTVLFADRRERLVSQVMMAAAVAVVVVGGFVLIWFFSHPYAGGTGSVGPGAMRGTATMLAVELHEDGSVDPHCEADGVPLRRGAEVTR